MTRVFLFFLFIFSLSFASAQQTVGTFINSPEALNAYTLFSVSFGKKTYIVDNCGEVINEWSHEHRCGLGAYLLDDGSLLRTSHISHPQMYQTSHGGLIERIAWDGELIWSFDFTTFTRNQHHEVDYMPNGNILVLGYDFIPRDSVQLLGRNTNLYPLRDLYGESIYEIEPIGTDSARVVWEWHMVDHMVQDVNSNAHNYVTDFSAHPRKMNFNYEGNNPVSEVDWFHCNAIAYHADRDEILLNARNTNEFFIIDHSTTTAEAATDSGGQRGHGGDFLYRWGNVNAYDKGSADEIKLFGAHNVQWIPEDYRYGGKIIIFNNGNRRPGPDFSTVEIIDPALDSFGNYMLDSNGIFLTTDVTTIAPDDFFSRYQSNAVILPNGHLFTNQGDNARFREYDENGEVVWDYISPAGRSGATTQGSQPNNNSVFNATRLPVDHPAFADKDLTPQGVIELNSDFTDCEIYSSVEHPENNHLDQSYILTRLADELHITSRDQALIQTVALYDMRGRTVIQQSVSAPSATLSTSLVSPGMYVIEIRGQKSADMMKIFIN